MSLTINTNVTALFAQNTLDTNQTNLANTLTQMSSGLRINNASDDPAGLAIGETMLSNINSLGIGTQNAEQAQSLLQTAQGAMEQVLNTLQQMSDLATQSANGVYDTADRSDLNTEYGQLLNEVNQSTASIQFNGIDLLGGGSITVQVGISNGTTDRISISLVNTNTGSASLNIAGTDISTQADAWTAMGSLSTAMTTITTGLATIGAAQANLNATIANNESFANNLTSARSVIMDADMAAESSNLAKYNILNQANVAMLAQANAAPQLVLQLLQG